MDYGKRVDIARRAGWADFLDSHAKRGGRLVLMTTTGAERLDAFRFERGDCLIMGRESAGVPDFVHTAVAARVVIPLAPGVRSLNVAMAAAIALWAALDQTGDLPSS